MGKDNAATDSNGRLHLQGMRHTRAWEDAHLPIYGSLLGRDLVLLLTQLYLESRALSLKEIYLSLPYSENAVRQHLQRLKRGAWVRLEGTPDDKRVKAIRLTKKFEHALQGYLKILSRHTPVLSAELAHSAARSTTPAEPFEPSRRAGS